MKIAIFIGGLSGGGAERVVCNLSNYLARRHTVTILTMASDEPIELLDSNIIRVALDEERQIDNFLMRNYKRYRNLKKYLKIAYSSADVIISVSNIIQKNILNLFKINSIVIGNMIDNSLFKFRDEKKDVNNGLFRFISVGHLIKGKGFDVLIYAFARAVKKNENIVLNIIGDGEEYRNLKNIVEDLGIKKWINFLGFCPRDKIALEYSISDCFILTSRHESFGVVYIEALACGLPVIGTKCGGPEDFINDQNGILVNIDDIDDIEKAIIKISNDSSYDRKKIARDISEKYYPDIIAKKIENIYKEVLKEYD